jgi:hypothetical protein
MKIWMENGDMPQCSLGDVDDAVVASGTEYKRNEFCGSFISAYCSVATD